MQFTGASDRKLYAFADGAGAEDVASDEPEVAEALAERVRRLVRVNQQRQTVGNSMYRSFLFGPGWRRETQASGGGDGEGLPTPGDFGAGPEIAPALITAIVVALVLFIIVLIVGFTMVRYVARTALIGMVKEIEDTGTTSVKSGFRTGWSRSAFRLFLIDLVIGIPMTIVVLLLLFALQIVFSRVWLRGYRFGPLEWLLRSLTYWKLQPMRRTGAT